MVPVTSWVTVPFADRRTVGQPALRLQVQAEFVAFDGPLQERTVREYLDTDRRHIDATAARVLRAQGYTVIDTPSAAAALQLCEHPEGQSIQLLLTDVVMPEMSGWSLAEQLAARLPNLRVLFMSGYTEHTAVQLGHIGADAAYLAKPFTPADLARRVRAVLDSP